MRTLAVFFLLSSVLALGAQTGGTIRGQIVDPTGAAIGRATVRVLDETSRQTVQTVQSDEDGRFEAPEPAPGQYSLAVWATGFAEKLVPVGALAAGSELVRTVQLEVLDCDAPGVNCDIFTQEPYTDPHPIVLQKRLTLRALDAVDLESGSVVPLSSPAAELSMETRQGGLYVTPLNKAALARSCTGSTGCCRLRPQPHSVRIDGLGPNVEIFLKTRRGQCSKVFLTGEAPPGAAQVSIYLVTRAK